MESRGVASRAEAFAALNSGHKGPDGKAGTLKLYPTCGYAAMDPLSREDRIAISVRIQREVTQMAMEIIRSEQEVRSSLSVIHIKCISLLLLALVAVGFACVYLRGMIVPLLLAVFFMFLLEPLLFLLLDPRYLSHMLRFNWGSMPSGATSEEEEKEEEEDKFRQSEVSFSSTAIDEATVNVTDVQVAAEPNEAPSRTCSQVMVQDTSWRLYVVFSVVTCVLALLGVFGVTAYFGIKAVAEVKWSKYSTSRNWRLMLDWFPQLANEDSTLRGEKVISWLLQGPLVNALDLTLTIISEAFLTMLFLVFLLFSDAMAVEETKGFANFGRKVRHSMRRYIRIKTVAALSVAILCGILYGLLEVDLYFLFAVCTFVLCYIPHVGNTIAVLAPLPMVFLDPDKTTWDLVVCFALPFTIHQLTANLIEPKVLSKSLDLHPIVVIMSLGFWASIWGAIGAILSVPLTAVIRMMLLESEHPYAIPIANLLCSGSTTRRPSKAPQQDDSRKEEPLPAPLGSHPFGEFGPLYRKSSAGVGVGAKSPSGTPLSSPRMPRSPTGSSRGSPQGRLPPIALTPGLRMRVDERPERIFDPDVASSAAPAGLTLSTL